MPHGRRCAHTCLHHPLHLHHRRGHAGWAPRGECLPHHHPPPPPPQPRPLPNTSPPQSTAPPFSFLPHPSPSGITSPAGPYLPACNSPRRHCQPEAHARGPWRGDAEGPRVPPWRARPLGRPYTSRGYRLQVAGGCAGFCMRLDMVPLQRLSRHEHGRGGRGSAPRASFHSTPSTPHSGLRTASHVFVDRDLHVT